MIARIVSIGDELVRGLVVDRNAAFLARELERLGCPSRGTVVVGDDVEGGARVLREALAGADLVVATGGLGPTEDDRTREMAVAATGVPLGEHAGVRRDIEELVRSRGVPVGPGHARQACVPRGAGILPNPVGTAPGFHMRVARASLVVLPGVPREMEAIFREHVAPLVLELQGGATPPAGRTLHLFGVPESVAGTFLAGAMGPEADPRIGITADGGVVSIHLTARRAGARGARRVEETAARIREGFGGACFGEGADTLESVVGAVLRRRRLRLAVAESCTGGLVGAMLTRVSGISEVFVEGMVTYSNESKRRALGVPASDLERHGAVSEPVALAMARGAARRAGVPLALGITGIAGPGGGTPAKPVGTVFIALDREGEARAERYRFHGDRRHVRLLAARTALARLLGALRDRDRRGTGGGGSPIPFDIEGGEC